MSDLVSRKKIIIELIEDGHIQSALDIMEGFFKNKKKCIEQFNIIWIKLRAINARYRPNKEN